MKILPEEPTEEMIDNTRSFLAGSEIGITDFEDMLWHLENSGAFIPDWFRVSAGHLNKMAKAHYIYDAMYDKAAPDVEWKQYCDQVMADGTKQILAHKKRIAELERAIRETIEENLYLADGENCTLIKLKQAINYDQIYDQLQLNGIRKGEKC